MAKRVTEKTQKIETTSLEDSKLEREVIQFYTDSKDYMKDLRDTWDDKEAMLLGTINDEISQNTTKSQVFDPRLSTIVFDRASRVMAKEHIGHAYAMSKDDIGKNKLMNLLVSNFNCRANEQFPMLTKLRMMDLYSLVYGSMFALVPWRINSVKDYIGPELTLIPIRDIFPQPNTIFADSDRVQVRTYTSIEWLKKQDKDVWKNIDAIEDMYKDTAGDTRETSEEDSSLTERNFHPDQSIGDKRFPKIELITEYRHDKWITFCPRSTKNGMKSTKILRVVENPDYMKGTLPVVKKDAFPLLDRAIGLGEFERGEKLQKSINSLINLYMDGIKMSIFPPIQINPEATGLVPSSIKMSPAAKWLVGRPNVDLQMTSVNPQGINTFNSTYGFLVGALNSQAGTTSVNEGDNVSSSVGKTPQAIKLLEARENSRDAWDTHMMDEAIREIYVRWVNLIAKNMEKPEQIRLFGAEIEDLAKSYPDIRELVDMSDSGQYGELNVTKKDIEAAYDYKVEAGSTVKRDYVQEATAMRELFDIVTDKPHIIEKMNMEGKDIVMSELVSRAFATSGTNDWDKIVVDMEQQQTAGPEQAPQEAPQPIQMPQIQDPAIMQAAQSMLGGMSGIPVRE